ncbi:NAD-dependent succinate-semialdehyde dehydrogenase [Tamlana sp. 62-3]|uniref:NAD-dependent succinate-semialdehyde dehydrogenase n=1 Tax=Neotamlana sargassicola TaxID=2883125 RepID=A0A9X1I6C6_9FLAO|nr:NAD-dependent succinate-semialdehyde dehydrogenase [Tamlana sargassicola]MCB4808092.1 NAD-dependent succinate-semialdehyde dehydrogenase [Tamlana sargassicola]
MKNKIETINPYNQEPLQTYKYQTKNEIDGILKQAASAFEDWRNIKIKERLKLLENLANLMEDNKEKYAKLMTAEMGKPISQSIAEIEKCVWLCDFYITNAEGFLADSIIETDAHESFISYDPLGAVLAVMPWNYPFWQVMRFAIPSLTAGNVGLLKHASSVSGTAIAIQELFEEAGYPKGCFQTLLIGHELIEDIIASDTVKAVTLTGSEAAGRSVAAIAGKNLKKTVLELGGNNACVVFDDANLDEHLETMVKARMQNTGQSCIAAKRFIVSEGIYDEFLERFTRSVLELNSGNPEDNDVFMGVMAREDLAEELEEQVNQSVKMGAKIITGNKRHKAYFEPTIVTEVTTDMPVFKEETFGPVAAIIKAKNNEEAIALAANSRFGLGTMIFTENIDSVYKEIGNIPDGALFVNDMVKSDPRLPFGGTKASGYGRELSKEGIMEFVNVKTVYIKK